MEMEKEERKEKAQMQKKYIRMFEETKGPCSNWGYGGVGRRLKP